MANSPKRPAPGVAAHDLVSVERQIVNRLIDQYWGVVRSVAECDPPTAQVRLQSLHSTSETAEDVSQLVVRYALARRAAGLPVFRPSAA